MTDAASGGAARVRRALDEGLLVHPDDGSANLVHLARAMASLAGAAVDTSDARTRRLSEIVGPHAHYVFVLVDGLGMNVIDRLPADAWLRCHVVEELRAIFPSSTAPALTSIATGCWPAEHAVTGWWTYLPDAGVTATILPFVERFSEQPLEELHVEAAQAFPIAAHAGNYTHEFMTFTPRRIADSTYSRYSSGGAPFSGYGKLGEAIDAILERIRSAPRPTYSYLYVPHVDFEEHLQGPHAPQVMRALEEVQEEVGRLSHGAEGRARIVITADHGLMTVGELHVLDRDDALIGLLRFPPTGDGRAPMFHVRDGMHEAFAAAFHKRFGDGFALLPIREAEAMGLFGAALSAETRRRAGDLIGIALADDVIAYEPKSGDVLRGHHGGLTPDEMRIPLMLA